MKLHTRYYADTKVEALDDATEVMFVRSLALAGEREQGGFIPTSSLPLLARRRRYGTCVDALVAAGLWTPADGGYVITRWSDRQAGLDRLAKIRATDRERKRRKRAEEKSTSEPLSAGQSTGRPPPQKEEEELDLPKGGISTHDPPDDSPPPHRCQQHQHWTGPVPACRACADARRHRDDWHTRHPNGLGPPTAAPRPPPVEAVLAATRGPTPDPDRNVTQIRQLRAGLRRPRPQDTP